ncbi:MAG: glucosidase [Candidatus Riflebacteria bacterium HGW-Riflebacteria-1]|jgi:catechol 2,3-dioxygenase-like lactoylglutathione lyase family enzyme|nr:MAG: glucosidase [Candidatus Riflebacteria bacterium HGW-Riflebacteria-1]
MCEELKRLSQQEKKAAHWWFWGPYLSERQWGTVREDYSPDGNAWNYFPHDHARSRAYRWGEDGIAGISDNHQRLCFALAMWNGRDSIIKERFFGLSGPEGNHGEDVKEYYYYLDNTPTHSYMKALYKYPQAAFPYEQLVQANSQRGYDRPEFELVDTGVFAAGRYFDVVTEYAKHGEQDILVRITAFNRGQDEAELFLLPTLWFRNTWSWHAGTEKPLLKRLQSTAAFSVVEAAHAELGTRFLYIDGEHELVFTENNTSRKRLYGVENETPYVKDGINDWLVNKRAAAVNPEQSGTKVSACFRLKLKGGEAKVIRLRLSNVAPDLLQPFSGFEDIFQTRLAEADEFYAKHLGLKDDDAGLIARQAYASLLWTKQYYHLSVEDWLSGDPAQPVPRRALKRNAEWVHLYNDDILSMPDKWEFPWYAAWDLAFHMIPFAEIDPAFAKRQLDRLTREWYMHPNGQIPAYEWKFSDVNPPVHAWATLRVYQIEREIYGRSDTCFLERVFQKLLLNFTWWVNRKDNNGNNVFQGGFLGLDNIGIFDRSSELPTGGYLEQADGTSWMGMYCLNMLEIALELAKTNRNYEDIASKFFEHFLYIASAMSHIGAADDRLWDDEDNFYYDLLHTPHDESHHLKIRSMVGLIPLFAVSSLLPEMLDRFAGFSRRFKWFLDNRPKLLEAVASMTLSGVDDAKLLAIVDPEKLRKIMARMLDENEFLGPYGIRSLSKHHEANPYVFYADGTKYQVGYEPGESRSGMFGGNSNWRGPVWFPVNYLIIESLQSFHRYLGADFKVECPTGSGVLMNLDEVAAEISRRLTAVFLRDTTGRRAVFGRYETLQNDPHWRDLLLFNEYFHGDDGSGLGANHQTGWTALVATLLRRRKKL